MNKKIITAKTAIDELFIIMSDGNPGALTVLIKLFKECPRGIANILHFDDLNLRGSQIWEFYKDYCGEKISKVDWILNEDREMAKLIAMKIKNTGMENET